MLNPANDHIPASYARGRSPGRQPILPEEPIFTGSHVVSYGIDGRIERVDGQFVSHDPVTGRISSIGGRSVSYDSVTGRISKVGNKYVRHEIDGRAHF